MQLTPSSQCHVVFTNLSAGHGLEDQVPTIAAGHVGFFESDKQMDFNGDIEPRALHMQGNRCAAELKLQP